MQHFIGPPNPHDIIFHLQADLNFLRESLPEIDEAEFLYANLLKRTDFPHDLIQDVLEFEPTDSQLEVIGEYIEIWNRMDVINDEIDEYFYEDDVVIFQELF